MTSKYRDIESKAQLSYRSRDTWCHVLGLCNTVWSPKRLESEFIYRKSYAELPLEEQFGEKMQYEYVKNKEEHPDPIKAEVKGMDESKLQSCSHVLH